MRERLEDELSPLGEISHKEGAVSKLETDEEQQAEKKNHDDLELVLKMFGTDKARRNFMELLDTYREVYLKHRAANLDTARHAEFGRSGIHNEIMDTLKHLALTVKDDGSPEETALRNMASRSGTHEHIRSWYAVEDRKRHHDSPLRRFREKGIDTIIN